MTKTGGIAADQLKSIIERIERLEEEKAGLASDIRDVFAEAKGNGFDVKTIRQIIRLRKMEHSEREEYEALLDIYKAALGMLGDTPLGEAAIRKLSPSTREESAPKKKDPSRGRAPPEPDIQGVPVEPGPTIDEARAMAREAAASGKPVTANPFPARDARRAAWDEEWCRSTGTDGMELPDAWRRKPKKPDGQEPSAKKGDE